MVHKKNTESDKEYIVRLFNNKEKYNLSNKEIAEFISKETGNRKDESVFRKWYKAYKEGYADGVESSNTTLKKIELESIKKQIQTEKIELNKWLREYARCNLFYDKVYDAINNLPKLDSFTYTSNNKSSEVGVLCISDAHYGIEVEMRNCYNDVVNVYNTKIFIDRMNTLLNMIIDDYKKYFNYKKMVVFDLGDAIHGMLRMSDIAKLQIGVVDAAIEYAEIISNWLVKLSNILEIDIEYICLGGNHAEMRLLESKKNFENENLGKVIHNFVSIRLENNPHVAVAPFQETVYKEIDGLNILAYHGEDAKSDSTEVNFWQNYHNIKIDIMLEGHLHHHVQNTISCNEKCDQEVIKCPSIIGVDLYSKKIRQIAKSGAKFFIVENGIKTFERTYILN